MTLPSNQIVRGLFIAFIFVATIMAAISWSSISTGLMVKQDSHQLVQRHIPELESISALQRALDSQLNQLYLYYATTDGSRYADNANQRQQQISEQLQRLQQLGLARIEIATLSNALQQYQRFAGRFSTEMQRPERSWDSLRLHLADAQFAANGVQQQLDQWQRQIHTRSRANSQAALTKVETLTWKLIVFSLVMMVVASFVLFALYGRLKDRDQLFRLAYFDSDTQLPNRRALIQQLPQHHQGALVLLKLDRHAMLSASYGHSFSSKVMHTLTDWLQSQLLRQQVQAKLYRINDDSWALLCQQQQQQLQPLLQQLQRISATPFCIEQRSLNLRLILGITHFPADGSKPDQLLRNADAALQAASNAGAEQRIYDSELIKASQQWLATESGLRHALAQQQFELHYQAKVRSDDRQLASAEALIRWRHNEQLVSPGLFIPVAEQSGLIVPIGTWVLQHACWQLAQWQQQGRPPCPIAINVSVQQFQQDNFCELVASAIHQHQIPACLLELEITEEIAATDPNRVIHTMARLKALGVSLALDDFGTGYSSLSYLQQLPIDTLKIDRAFVTHLHRNPDNAAIVDVIMGLAQQRGLTVVAEGVETEAECLALQQKQCQLLQGFLFARPQPAAQFEQQWLSPRPPETNAAERDSAAVAD
ncbi:bifunctional diguanylate cyclase/phosphodiesterase [uncultured Ferrimonas sp.]|uniref:putative bifunctional diguanylate cyclase/phosphodiesterase n=1 Tax=uncultured Ferrimonas sp. TaxID=432640 RepID=UPI0026126DD8|nr:bifunctional diguanylate cyclase/phosphodiesterase [uncultured Ferrimonas sp.]